MRTKPTPPPIIHEPAPDPVAKPTAVAEPVPVVGVGSDFIAWPPHPQLTAMHAKLGGSLWHARCQIGGHLNEATNGLKQLVIDLESIKRMIRTSSFLKP